MIPFYIAFDADFFAEIGAYFGGGTQLALQFNEFRWSKDVDFICPMGPGYKTLRKEVGSQGYDALFRKRDELSFPRDIKADQYGIRFALVIEDTLIKFEIIAEGRISLGKPAHHSWCPVPCLNFDDACSEKLLSNADRWADESIESRDLIDLAVLRQQGEISASAFNKANDAYDVSSPLLKALEKFQASPEYRSRCFKSLQIDDPVYIIDGIDLLASDHNLDATKRSNLELKY